MSSRSRSKYLLLLAPIVVALPAMVSCGTRAAQALQSGRQCPVVTDLRRVSVEIASISFVDEVQGLDGNKMKVPADKKDKFRIALVTLRITKPPGEKLTLAAADLTLHYYHGDETEAAPCEGISVFGSSLDSDRPLKMPSHAGPGFVKQTTGTGSTQSGTVYIDAAFNYIEPNIGDTWIVVGQPSTSAPYRAKSPGGTAW